MSRFIKVNKKRIDPDLQRKLFAVGASYRPPQTIQCDSKKIYDAVINVLQGEDVTHEDVEYVQKSMSLLGKHLMQHYLELVTHTSRRQRRESI